MSKTVVDRPDKANEIGTLIVVLLKARNLNDRHSFRKQDVFAQASLNGVQKRTKVEIKGGQHPVWDDEVRFPIMKSSTGKFRNLEVACYAKEPRSDDLLGKCVVDIAETLRTGEFDDWVNLEVDGVARGEMYLEMTYFTNAAAPAAAPSASNKLLSTLQSQNGSLSRRPSKLSPQDRLSYPGYQAGGLGSSKLPSQPSRLNVQFAPSQQPVTLPSSLAPSHGGRTPPDRANSPLLMFPNEPPYGRPNRLGLGSEGRPWIREQQGATPLPTTLRPGSGNTPPAPALNPHHGTSHVRNPSYSPPNNWYNQQPVQPSISTPVDTGGVPNPYIGSGPSTVPATAPHAQIGGSNPYTTTPVAPHGSRPAPQALPPLWGKNIAGGGPPPASFSFPTPILSPTSESFGQTLLPYSGPRPSVSAPSLPYNLMASPPPGSNLHDDFDPYLQTRYQTPLPLPPGANRPAPSAPASIYALIKPETPKPVTDQARIDALRRAEADAKRRQEQELHDLELAMQLDRELNLS